MTIKRVARMVLCVGVFLPLIAGCADGPITPLDESESPLFKKDKTVPPTNDVPVAATFRDAADDGVASDGGEPYDAIIRENGNLLLDVRDDIPRVLCIHFASQAGAPSSVCADAYMTTSDADVEGAMLEMNVADRMTTRALVYWSGVDPADGKNYGWFLRYGIDCDRALVAETRLTVTHYPDGTWTLEGQNAVLCRMPTRGRPLEEMVGNYSMPFSLTLVR